MSKLRMENRDMRAEAVLLFSDALGGGLSPLALMRHFLLTFARCCSTTSWNCPARKKQTSSDWSGRSFRRLSLRSALSSAWLSSIFCSISTISITGTYSRLTVSCLRQFTS